MNLNGILIAAAGAALLGGCAIGPDYQRPASASTLPIRYDQTSNQTAVPVASQWWKLFGDPVLDRLVEQALGGNADLLAAVARMEEADAAMRETGAALIPEVKLEAGASRTRASTATATPMPPGTPVLRDNRKAALTTTFELDVWGRLRRADEASRAQALAGRYARDTVRLSIAAQVSTRYLSLRALDVQVVAAADSEASQSASRKIMQSRLEAGAVSPLELYQAENALAAAQAQSASLRRQRAQVEHQLGLLVGQPELALAPGDLEQLPLPPLPPPGLPSSLLEARPDVRQAEEALIAANAQIGVVKAALFPTLSLTGSLGSESKALNSLFSTASGTGSLALGLTMPLLDSGRHSAQVDQATARQRQATADYQKAVHSAFKEVRDALVEVREDAEAEQAQSARLSSARKALQLMRVRHEAGYSAYAQVLEAQRAEDEARQAHAGTRQARLTAAVNLFKALGGGWQENPPPR
ncbi:efflux transporter outer membrane subunit [Denitratisoma oestradiolicum]|uniref:RND transporter n=1 Tax=Denitratisoma oestradiolicum TaxID=311182 RepID=A0A6S6Y0I6_9PROT|nr:efflux transporter outer membrane subunit [Denitratisoma oestradiolicum]TWO80786.1 RND transporter [Denitratisoma oestradiolicum]CAB1370898.1 RND transporter [Denitratisoma oestradiolicum]